jgi:UPF0042 nucleotide-binding protein
VVITGLSGSGKSTALKALEDLGFYAVDNLPAELLPSFVQIPLEHAGEPLRAALVMDLRTSRFVELFQPMVDRLTGLGHRLELLFLEATDEVLIRRFSQTRRGHPLADDGDAALDQGIARERKLLRPIRARASVVMDTTHFNVHQLRQAVGELYRGLAPAAQLNVNLLSFGYKYGLPHEADLVMDVRFLPNPYYVEELKPLDGREQPVVDYVCEDGTAEVFLKRFKDLLAMLLPRYLREGKSQLTIAIGCTGGRHRSVVVSEWLSRHLEAPGCRVSLRHRDVDLG